MFKSLLLAGMLFSCVAFADDAGTEKLVRELDRQEADAVLNADYDTMDRLWAQDYKVNNPRNQVVNGREGGVRSGARTYSSFVREAESVQVHGETVVVMGRETVVPTGTAPDSGTTIHRRYTNIWMKRDGAWRLTGRHANVIATPCDTSRAQ